MAQLVKNPPAMQETLVRLLTPVFLGFPCGSAGKEFTCNVGDLGFIPGLGRKKSLEKEIAAHSSISAWRIPWAEELGRLQSRGHRVGND